MEEKENVETPKAQGGYMHVWNTTSGCSVKVKEEKKNE